MGNDTNIEQWAAQERLRAIERAAYWRGWVRRKELVSLFGISMAQASADFQKYLELNPSALHYNLNAKRYEGAEAMTCVRHEPRLEEAVACYLEGGAEVATSVPMLRFHAGPQAGRATVAPQLGFLKLPMREAKVAVSRWVFQAVLGARQVRMRYWSLSSGKAGWRKIAPHALAHDGYRWHVRAWCRENEDYRDFVLSRIEKCAPPCALTDTLPADDAWNQFEEITLRPDRRLTEAGRAAIQRDYGMGTAGKLKIRIRKAMKPYLLGHLFIAESDSGEELPRHLELADHGY